MPAPTSNKTAIRKPYKACVSGRTEKRIPFPNTLGCLAVALIDAEAASPWPIAEIAPKPTVNPAPTATKLIEQIKGELDNHVGGAPQFDDITMLAVHRKIS